MERFSTKGEFKSLLRYHLNRCISSLSCHLSRFVHGEQHQGLREAVTGIASPSTAAHIARMIFLRALPAFALVGCTVASTPAQIIETDRPEYSGPMSAPFSRPVMYGQHLHERELTQLRAMIALDYPGIMAMDPMRRALTLRDAVYDTVPLGSTPPGLNAMSPIANYNQSMHMSYDLLCGGLSRLYVYMLEASGINARMVGMWAHTDERTGALDGHVSVEAHIYGRWIAMDPTFNLVFRGNGGRELSWTEVRNNYERGWAVTPDHGGMGQITNRTLDSYYVTLTDLTRNMTLAPGLSDEPAENLGWDGILTFADGSTLDFGNSYNNSLEVFIAMHDAAAGDSDIAH